MGSFLSQNNTMTCCALLVLLFAACAPQPTPPAPSAWGAVVTTGNAEQTHAPALLASPGRVTLAWVGATQAGVHHDVVALQDSTRTPVITLPLPPTFPRNSRLFPAAGERSAHLLWLDVNDAEAPQLHSAVIDETLGVFRGPLTVSKAGARCFDTFPHTDNALWAVWHSGTTHALYSAYIEPSGLTLRHQHMLPGGGCPAAVETFDGRYLLWEQDGALHAAQFRNGAVSAPRAVGEMPTLFVGDRLRGLRAGSDGTRLYAFWNITRSDGGDETWFTSGTPNADMWQPPRRLMIAPNAATAFETTFNTGQTAAATERVDGLAAAWAAPLRTPNNPLPVAVQVNKEALGVVYLRDGGVVGWQRIVSTNPLLGVPELQTDQNRHLYLAWAAPQDTGTAHMQVTATRRLSER